MKKKLVEMECKGCGAPSHVQGTILRAVYKTNPIILQNKLAKHAEIVKHISS
jgi:hypothetical protein